MKSPTLIDRAFFLKQLFVFEILDLNVLLALADKLSLTKLDEKEVLFSEGANAERLYFIAKGEIALYRESETLALLKKGELFGEESIFSEESRGYMAVAKIDSVLFTLSRTHFLTLLCEYPQVSLRFLRLYTTNQAYLKKICN